MESHQAVQGYTIMDHTTANAVGWVDTEEQAIAGLQKEQDPSLIAIPYDADGQQLLPVYIYDQDTNSAQKAQKHSIADEE
jgi:hypothetical protein